MSDPVYRVFMFHLVFKRYCTEFRSVEMLRCIGLILKKEVTSAGNSSLLVQDEYVDCYEH